MFGFFSKYKKARSLFIYFGIGTFLFVQVFGFLLLPQPVQALPVTDAGVLGAITGQTVNDTVTENKKEVKQNIGNVLLSTFLGALMQGVSYFTRKLAYDTASFIAAGGKGQSAQVFVDGFGVYLGNVAADAGATAIEEIGQPFGLNLCSPPNLQFQTYLQVGIRGLYPDDANGQGPRPSCTWQEIQGNWESYFQQLRDDPGQTLTGASNVEEFFTQNLRTSQTDFGIALGAIAQVGRTRAQAQAAASLERLEGEGFKSVTDLISGDIKTPGQVVKEETKALTANNQTQLTTRQVAGIYGSSALQILPTAASVFLNTLVSQLLNNLIGGGGGLVQNSEVDTSNFTGSPGSARRQAAERAFSFLLATPTIQTNEIDIIAEYYACDRSNNGASNGINNCVMDNGLFEVAIRSQQGQQPLTIQEAIDEGKLHANWPLISFLDVGENADILGCTQGKYCYSNIQKLRKVRLLPLGFEIAAARSNIDNPVTLGEVVSNFENCGPRNPDRTPVNPNDPNFPFCHLINPNWVIKAPVARCEALVFGPELLAQNTDGRRQECVDVSTCVSFNEDGSCEHYGYCTREQNVWDFPGDTCAAEFATCETFTNTQTGQRASYLGRSVDVASCNAQTVGCRAYSTEELSSGEWISSGDVETGSLPLGSLAAYQAAGRNPVTNFNGSITASTCPEGADGCQQLIIGSEILDDGDPRRRTFEYATDAGGNVETLNMRLAPESLGCYDTDPSTPQIEYPRTAAELALTSRAESCSDYAAVCVEEEVGCESHIPLAGDRTPVPGIIGANACAAECVGYETFVQEESEFEREIDPLYFIPSYAQTCSAQHVGCSEFTNLDELGRGGESRQYFADIKYCEKPEDPDRANEKTFYAYEGSAQQGFVLRIYNLKFDDQQDRAVLDSLLSGSAPEIQAELTPSTLPTGTPLYADLTTAALEENYAKCNEDSYRALITGGADPADPDCREFFDDDQNIFYRLLNQTVQVSDQCVPLRITNPDLYADTTLTEITCEYANGFWDGSQCSRCRGGGFYVEGQCIYNSIASEATQCPASANECRAYSGNFVGNVQQIFDLDFEPADDSPEAITEILEDWTDATLSSESLQLGGSSLQIDTRSWAELDVTGYAIDAADIPSTQYELRFWARSNQSHNLNVGIYSDQGFISDTFLNDAGGVDVPIGNDWREYVVYTRLFDPLTNPADEEIIERIAFEFPSAGASNAVYIDNLRLTRVSDTQFFIKNSWQVLEEGVVKDVPGVCDSNPIDDFPGEALGCQAYIAENSGAEVYATGFEQLCRPEAVGCFAFYDTYNTDVQAASVYNAWCDETTCDCPSGIPGECSLVYQGATLGTCVADASIGGCYVDQIVYPTDVVLTESFVQAQPYITESSVVVPSDTPEDAPMFLAAQPQSLCSETFLGCTGVGLEQQILPGTDSASYDFSETFIINNPAQYQTTLCTSGEVGCSEFQSSDTIRYFKDPTVTGQSMCRYRTDDGAGTPGTGGWFYQDIGRCSDDATQLCLDDAQCSSSATCIDIGNVACYPDVVERDGRFGLLSNDNPAYDGLVGLCPDEANQCTQFIDRADVTIDNPGGTPYHVIFDEQIEARIGDCQGQASLRDGCVLFDKTDNPAKLFDTEQTYSASEDEIADGEDGLVIPATGPLKDSNIILKVDRDRQCREWLSCRNEVVYRDESGNPITLCYDYERCTEAEGERCTSFVQADPSIPFDTQLLTKDVYVSRDTSWYGDDYSGYSLADSFPVADFTYTEVDIPLFDGTDTTFLGYQIPEGYLTSSNDCLTTGGQLPNFSACGDALGGLCLEGLCMLPIDGEWPAGYSQQQFESNPDAYLIQNSCKGYPEETSPFPQTILARTKTELRAEGSDLVRYEFGSKKEDFQLANVCQDGACSCAYQKVSHFDGARIDYWPVTESNVPSAICAGINDGVPCVYDPSNPNGAGANNECTNVTDGVISRGTCRPARSIEKRLGTFGYCLEYDVSRPINGGTEFACLTWLPLGVSASQLDIFNQSLEAGYYPVSIYDAPNGGGQVYCTDSRAVGRGLYDDDYFRQFYFDEMDSRLRGSFSQFLTHQDTEDCPARTCRLEQTRVNQWYRNGADLDDFRDTDWQSPQIREIFEVDPDSTNFSFPVHTRDVCRYEIIDAGDSRFNDATSARSESYEDYVCLSGGRPADQDDHPNQTSEQVDIVTMIQNWAWRFIGTNAHVLRTELVDRPINPKDGSVLEPHYEWGYWNPTESAPRNWTCTPEDPDDLSSGCDVTALLPFTYGDSDVMMHPPRQFDTGGQEHRQMRKTISFTSHQTGAGPSKPEPITVFTDHHSATAVDIDTRQDRIYISPVQQSLNEKMLERVHILPLSFPGGAEGRRGPRIMDQELYIDVAVLGSLLDNESTKHEAVTARTGIWTRAETGVGVLSSPHNDVFPRDWIRRSDMTWYTYGLEREDDGSNCNGLLSYCSYNDDGYDYSGSVDYGADPKNQIHRRYVGVFYSQNHTETQFVSQFAPTSANNDPFRAPCEQSEQEKDLMWFAIGLDFNEDGEFLGYISRHCGSYAQDGSILSSASAIQTAIVATMKDQCLGFASVYDPSQEAAPGATTNKAWTDRVWNFAQQDTLDLGGSIGAGLPLSAMASPFGTLRDLTTQNVRDSVGLRDYVFDDARAGYPFSCPRVRGSGSRLFTDVFDALLGCSALSQERGNYDYGYNDLELMQHIGTGQSSAFSAWGALTDNLFAKVFDRKRFNNTDWDFTSYEDLRTPNFTEEDPDTLDRSDTAGTALAPPRVHALDPSTCIGAIGGLSSGCTAAEAHTFSINGHTGTDTIYGGQAQSNTLLYGFGSHFVTARFFAFADHNRMPIRQVTFDWGDQNGAQSSIANEGRYKNRKPFCSVQENAGGIGECRSAGGEYNGVTCEVDGQCSIFGSGYTCESDDRFFGNAPRACQQGSFEYSHMYTCSAVDWELNGSNVLTDILDLDLQDQLRTVHGLQDDQPVCIYRPRVQVKDNWGYCNASRFNPTIAEQWDILPTGLQDERGVVSVGGTDRCDASRTDTNNSPWTYFGTEIVVIRID